MSKIITFKCECGAHIELTETESIELETTECPQCGTDNYVDNMSVVQLDQPVVAKDYEDFDDELPELKFD